ncbi:Androglobin, partial [Camelus dromedarius]
SRESSRFCHYRETFLVPQDMILVPKVYTTLPVCMLHVVNNDTMEQVPKVFQKVVPYLYTKNKKGYTFVAEAYTGDMYMPSSRWKLRLIGSYHPLPFLCRDPPCNTFAIKEIRDYYIPNDKKIVFRKPLCHIAGPLIDSDVILNQMSKFVPVAGPKAVKLRRGRYSLKVALPHPVTIQVRMSKPDAFIKLQILENEEVIVSATGKGQAIIPAINCLGVEKALSSQSSKQILLSHAAPKKEPEFYIKKKSAQGSQKYYKRLGSAIDTGQPIVDEESTCVPTTEENTSTSQQVYKYVIQCSVLYNSWPLTESQLMFVQALKDLEKNDSKAHGEKHEELITLGSPDSHTISEGQKSSGTSRITRKGKEKSSEKEKTAKEKQAPRFEPQAAQARLHYLSRFIKKMPDAESVPMSESQTKAGEVETSSSVIRESDTKSPMSLDSKETIPSGSTLWKKWQLSKSLKDLAKPTSSDSGGSSPSSFPKEEREQGMRKENIRPQSRSPTILEMSPQLIRKKLQCVDLSQYVRKTETKPLLRTEELSQLQAMQKAEEVHQFRQYRTRILSIRDIDQEERIKLRDRVLEMYKEMRDSVDEARQKILSVREEYRNKRLDAERLRLEALAAEEAVSRVEPEKKVPAPDTQKKKKGMKK